MALRTSNTFQNTQVDTRTFIDRAYGVLKLRPQQVTGEMVQIAQDITNLVQQDLVNDAMPQWTLRKELSPLIQGQSRYPMIQGTNDVESCFFRTMSNVTGTTSSSSAAYGFSFTTPTSVVSVQVIFPGASFPITIQSSPDNVTWTTVYTGTIYDQSLQANQNGSNTIWYDVFNNNAALFWQVIPSLTNPVNGQTITPPNTMVGVTATVYNNPADVLMARLNRDDFFNLTNKAFPGRPLQYRFDRQINPIVEVWPTPDLFSSQNLMVVYRQRLLQDVGTLQQTIEIPSRWYLPFLYMVAAELASCTPEVDPEWAKLVIAKSENMRKRVWIEDRDKSPIKFQSNIRVYTR